MSNDTATSTEGKDFASQVNQVIDKATKTDSGFVLPEEALKDVPEAIAFAAKSELRVRNTQANYTRGQQELAKQKGITDQLVQKLTQTTGLNLTTDEERDLKNLKINDPEAWRTKLASYEARSKQKLQDDFNEIEKASTNMSLVEVRKAQLQAFNEQTGIQLTDDIIKNELPPKYFAELEAGKVDFPTFLKNAQDFMQKNKVIKGADDKDPEVEPQLSKMAGGAAPLDKAVDTDIINTYVNAVF